MVPLRKFACFACLLLLAACTAPKPAVPSLTPEGAYELLHYHTKAQNWLIHVKKENASCDYKLTLPDQISHPAQLDLDHIVVCGNRPSPLELDASVSFEYDAATQHWVIKRFES